MISERLTGASIARYRELRRSRSGRLPNFEGRISGIDGASVGTALSRKPIGDSPIASMLHVGY